MQAVLFAQVGLPILMLIFFVLLYTLILAVIIRAACWLYNKMAGGPESPSAVPEPTFGKAWGMAFIILIINIGLGFLLGLAMGSSGFNPTTLDAANIISFVISMLVLAGVVAGMLPTTFGRGIIIAFLCLLVSIVIAGFIFLLIYVFSQF